MRRLCIFLLLLWTASGCGGQKNNPEQVVYDRIVLGSEYVQVAPLLGIDFYVHTNEDGTITHNHAFRTDPEGPIIAVILTVRDGRITYKTPVRR